MSHSPERLKAAKLAREEQLKRLTEDLTTCDCTWPLDTYRNGSGHDSNCPVHKRHEERRPMRSRLRSRD